MSEERKVPGARASTVQSDVWDLAFSVLSKSKTGLAKLFHSMLRPCARGPRASERKIWPTPLPFPEMHVRCSNRKQVDAARKLGTNYVVLVLNWFALGEALPASIQFGLGTKLSSHQWSAVKRIAPLVDSWNSHEAVDAAAMGRSASKVESLEDVLAELDSFASAVCSYHGVHGAPQSSVRSSKGFFGHPGTVVGSLGSCVERAAKDIEPERYACHGAPSFDPVYPSLTAEIERCMNTP